MDWARNDVTFAVRNRTGHINDEEEEENIIKWIDSFIESQRPNKLLLAGANIDAPCFRDVLKRSRAALYIENASPISSSEILGIGAATAAKTALESHVDDCGEWSECDEIRKKADEIAGSYKPPSSPLSPHLEL